MSQEGWHLDEDLRKAAERFAPHIPILLNIAARVDKLLTWGADWQDYEGTPPSQNVADQALRWIQQLYLEVLLNGRAWIDPLITASPDSKALFEWQRRGRRLTVRVTDDGITYSKVWGTRPRFQFEDGPADTPETRESIWDWLGG
jgi:hypothetical protein